MMEAACTIARPAVALRALRFFRPYPLSYGDIIFLCDRWTGKADNEYQTRNPGN